MSTELAAQLAENSRLLQELASSVDSLRKELTGEVKIVKEHVGSVVEHARSIADHALNISSAIDTLGARMNGMNRAVQAAGHALSHTEPVHPLYLGENGKS